MEHVNAKLEEAIAPLTDFVIVLLVSVKNVLLTSTVGYSNFVGMEFV